MAQGQEEGQRDYSAAEDLRLISDLARQAGQIALGYFGHNPETWLKEGDSPVSEADLAADAFLKKELLAARPDYGWISEETADDRPAAPYSRYFIVDPIDGTRGFLAGDRQWCVSVAVAEKGRPIAGALDCPALGEHYTAGIGGAALLNGGPVCPKSGAAAAAAHAGHPRISARAAELNRLPKSFTAAAEKAEHIPSLAYRLALLARGELEAVLVRRGCHDWDIAAADLILALSGGRLVNCAGEAVAYCRPPFRHSVLLGARAEAMPAMLDIVSAGDLR